MEPTKLVIFTQELPTEYQALSKDLQTKYASNLNKFQSQSTIFTFIKEWKAETISGLTPNIFKAISGIHFSQLKSLVLRSCQLDSIEGLQRFQLNPSTVQMHLNMIRSIRCLRKAQWLSLNWIDFGDNYIEDSDALTQMHMKDIRVYSIDYTGPLQFNDTRTVAKLEPKIKELYIYNQKRIRQRSNEEVLKRKYSGITISCGH